MYNLTILAYLFLFYNAAYYGNLLAKGDHLMATSYLKTPSFWNPYPEWMPISPLDSSLCTWRSHGPQSARGSIIPRWSLPLTSSVRACLTYNSQPQLHYSPPAATLLHLLSTASVRDISNHPSLSHTINSRTAALPTKNKDGFPISLSIIQRNIQRSLFH